MAKPIRKGAEEARSQVPRREYSQQPLSLLIFRYTQLERAGGIHGGHSSCVLEVLRDGRRIHEHFTWKTREGCGTDVFEQVNSGTS